MDSNRPGNGFEMSDGPFAAGNPTESAPGVLALANEADEQPHPRRSKFKLVTSLVALYATLFIGALNATVVATAIPTICHELNSASGFAWIGGAYLLGTAATAPVWAKLSDIWGRKIILLISVAGFFFSSIICALASTMTMLIAGRSLQGVAGGGLIQLVNIVISDLFSMRHRSLYLGISQIVWAVAGSCGPILGGAFAENLSWRWSFWIVLPVCVFAFFLLLFALDVHNPRTGVMDGLKAVDWAGSLSILAILVMFLLGLNLGGVELPWNSPTVICLIVIGLSMTAVFVWSEKKLARYPLMPLALFASKSNLAAIFLGFAQYWVVLSIDFYLPFFFQSAKALSPLQSGTLMLPIILSESLLGLAQGIYTHRTGRYLDLIWAGLIISTLGYGLFTYWDATTPTVVICVIQVIAGVGTGLLFTPPLLALQSLVSQKDTATATATYMLIKNIATVLAVVTGQAVFQNGMNHINGDLAAAGIAPGVVELLGGNEAAANVGIIQTIQEPMQRLAVQQAFAASLRNVWILDTCMIASGLLVAGFITSSVLSKEHVETRTGLEKEPIREVQEERT